MAVTKLVIFLAVFVYVSAIEVSYGPCDAGSSEQCDVKAVSIEPCKEAPKPCRLKKRSEAHIRFEFTPKFSAKTAKTAVYWANGALEPSFGDLEPDACKFTNCPFEAGKTQEYNYNLYLNKNIPQGSFPIKWKVWNSENEAEQCCFTTTILVRK